MHYIGSFALSALLLTLTRWALLHPKLLSHFSCYELSYDDGILRFSGVLSSVRQYSVPSLLHCSFCSANQFLSFGILRFQADTVQLILQRLVYPWAVRISDASVQVTSLIQPSLVSIYGLCPRHSPMACRNGSKHET